MTSQRALLLDVLARWRTERGEEAQPMLLYAMRCIGDPEGARPIDQSTLQRPLDMADLDALRRQLARLIDEVGMAEDFVVTGLVRAIEEHLASAVAERERDLSVFRALLGRFSMLKDKPADAAAFLSARGMSVSDLDNALRQLEEGIAHLEDAAWETERKAELEAWRAQTHDLVCPERRRAWEGERFQAAGEQLMRAFQAPAEDPS